MKIVKKVLMTIGYAIVGTAWWLASVGITLAFTGWILDLLGVG